MKSRSRDGLAAKGPFRVPNSPKNYDSNYDSVRDLDYKFVEV